jgi:hypothetical protein
MTPPNEKGLGDCGEEAAGGDVGAVVGAFKGDFFEGGVGAVTGEGEGFARPCHRENATAGCFEGFGTHALGAGMEDKNVRDFRDVLQTGNKFPLFKRTWVSRRRLRPP